METSLLELELKQVNKYIDERIKKNKKYAALEALRVEIINQLNNK